MASQRTQENGAILMKTLAVNSDCLFFQLTSFDSVSGAKRKWVWPDVQT